MSMSTLMHPLTGLDYTEPLYVSPSGRKFYPIGGAAPDDGENGGQGGENGGDGAGGDGGQGQQNDGGDGGQGGSNESPKFTEDGETYDFPPQTPLADMTADQQAEYWRHKARKHESASKAKDTKISALERDALPDSEKALAEAKEAGKREAVSELNGKVLDAHVDAFLAANKLTRDKVPAVDALDLTKFINDENDVDTDRLAAVLASLAPTTGNTGGSGPDMGQGNRGEGGKGSSGVSAGKDLYAQLHPTK